MSHHPASPDTNAPKDSSVVTFSESLTAGDAEAMVAKKKEIGDDNVPVNWREGQTPIYVKAKSKGDAISGDGLRTLVINALAHTNHFAVLDSNKTSLAERKEYVIDIRFAPKKGGPGVILAEFYDGEGTLIWNGMKDCVTSSPSPGGQVEDATRALIADMLSNVNVSRASSTGTE